MESQGPGRPRRSFCSTSKDLNPATALGWHDCNAALHCTARRGRYLVTGTGCQPGRRSQATSNAAPHPRFPRQFGNAGPRHACTGVSTTPPMPQPANANPTDPGSIDRDRPGRLAPRETCREMRNTREKQFDMYSTGHTRLLLASALPTWSAVLCKRPGPASHAVSRPPPACNCDNQRLGV